MKIYWWDIDNSEFVNPSFNYEEPNMVGDTFGRKWKIVDYNVNFEIGTVVFKVQRISE